MAQNRQTLDSSLDVLFRGYHPISAQESERSWRLVFIAVLVLCAVSVVSPRIERRCAQSKRIFSREADREIERCWRAARLDSTEQTPRAKGAAGPGCFSRQ